MSASKLAYRDLLKVTRETLAYAQTAVGELDRSASPEARALGAEIRRHRGLAERVIDQTERRVVRGESVPAGEKVVSIFEPHTDVIVKDRRETRYGTSSRWRTGVRA